MNNEPAYLGSEPHVHDALPDHWDGHCNSPRERSETTNPTAVLNPREA